MAQVSIKVKNRFSYQKGKGLSFLKSNPKSVSRTKQSFRKEADINCIMGKYSKSGLLTDPAVIPTRMPQFGDFSNVQDYQTMKNTMLAINSYFMSLPADLRRRFDNDPNKLLAFAADPNNKDEALKLGLLSHDLSKIKYLDNDGNDITQKVIDERGLYVKGQRVNLDGSPYTVPEKPKADESIT